MIYELAQPEEADALSRVHALAFDSPWSATEISALGAGAGSTIFLAREGDTIAGFIMCRAIADEAEVLTLATAPAHRRRGIGRCLLETAARAVADRGAARLFLEVAADNPGAIALYEGYGFEQVGVRSGYYSRPGGAIDALVMRRVLNT